jgi:DNA-binding response OmpR family regulator
MGVTRMTTADPLATDFPAARVLIADDHPQGAELIEAYLEGTGWETRIATDGEESLRLVREWNPDVVLLDVMMPKLSGFEVCKRLRSDPATKAIPVLMITALDQASDVDRAVDAGTNDFLTKPINKTDLVLRIRALLYSRAGATELERTIDYVNTVARVGV